MFQSISGRWLAVVLLLLLWASASCGGSSALGPAPGPQGDSRMVPLGSALPSLPDSVRDRNTPNTNLSARSTSALNSYNGADFIQASGATVDGTSVLLQSAPGQIAWALYKAK